MKKKYFFTQLQIVYHKITNGCINAWVITLFVLFCFPLSGYAQKNKSIEPVIYCVKELGNGLYQASFGYNNPTKKEVVLDENASIIKSNNGKKVAKGLNKFKPGSNDKVFTKEFGSGDYVEWEIISNGNSHKVIANANSAKKCEPDDGFIFPVYGQDNGKNNNLIGSKLRALAEGSAGDIPSPLIFQLTENKVLVEIVPKANQTAAVLTWLETYVEEADYLLPPSSYLELSAIDVYFPIDNLFDFNQFESINFVRPLYPSANESIGDGYTGESVSQGDTVQSSDIVRQAFRIIRDGELFPVDGTDIKVGVMSNSFNTQPATEGISKATTDVKNGDLPGALNTHGYLTEVANVEEWPFGEASDEGRAMLQIIHDIAPGASLAFHSASISPRNFEVGLEALRDEGCQIIVDDITFITEPFFGEGRISGVIKELAAQNIMHFTSAGNFGNAGYQGVFNATETLPSTNFITESITRAHVFDQATGDYLQKISVKAGETYMLVLQWADQVSASQDNTDGAQADLDFYIVDDAGRLLVGNNRSNKEGDAAEIMVFTASADGEANLMITSATTPVPVPFRYIAFKSAGLTFMEFNEGTPTVTGHAMTEESVTVGAIRFNKTEPEPFSSYGGTLTDQSIIQVDIAAPDGVNTNVGSIGFSFYDDGTPVDGDVFNNFFGTSAAAPSAAAGMALLQSALPVWYPDGNGGSTISVIEAIQLFKDNGRGSTNPLQTGSGMIDVNEVFKSLASQTARITSFTLEVNEDGSEPVPSAEPITIKIIGEFFPPAPPEGETYETYPIVYFDNQPLDYTVNEDGTITSTIPAFSGNPDLQLYTKPKPGSENNGGFSEPYKILQDGRIALNITVNDVLVKYGEDYRSKMSYSVEGIPVEGFPEGKNFEEYFPELVVSSTADAFNYPDVNNYVITAAFGGDGLSQEQLDNYQINFIKNGNLSVEKNFLTIKPNDQAITYGDIIDNTFNYQLTDEAGVAVPDDSSLYTDIDAFYAAITAAHDLNFYYDNYDENNPQSIMLLINDFNDDSERYSDITTLLEYGGWVSSENAILNGLIRQRNIMNDMRQSAILNDFRPKNIMNDFRQSALMNTLRIDKNYFTNYIDGSITNELRQTAIMNDEWIVRTSNIMNDLRQTGLMNDFRQSAVMNDMRVGAIMNIIDIIDLNVDAIVNGEISRQLGVMNDLRQSAVMNELRQSAIMNEEGNNPLTIDKIFSLIDYTDVPTAENLTNEIEKFYALNLITGIDATSEGEYHYIFPGAFLNAMAANFNVVYDKALVTIDKGILQVTAVDFESSYGSVLTDKDIPTTFSKTANYEVIEAIFPDGIPYYFMKEGDPIEYTLDGEVRMGVGIYDIFIRDEAANYNIEYGESHGKFTISEAALEVATTTAPAIKYGETPAVTTVFSGFADGEDQTTLFPESDGGILYYFMKQGDEPDCVDCIRYTIGGEEKMDVGIYNIFITDVPNDNYKIEHAIDRGTLTITEAILEFNPVADDINYGSTPVINPGFGDFAYAENSDILKDDQGKMPYYFMKEGDPTLYTVGGTEKMNVGVYEIYLTDDANDNYSILSNPERGTLTVLPLQVTVQTANLEKVYGYNLTQGDVTTIFDAFAHGENVLVVFGSEQIPYYFTDGSGEYEMEDAKDAGTYNIRIREANENYTFSYDAAFNLFVVTRKTLTATIDDLLINQGEVPQFTASFDGFVSGENEDSVYPEGIPYYFVDEYGTESDYNDTGAFTIRIRNDRKNYDIELNNATLFINPFDDSVKKVRTFADCVSYNNDGSYTVTFRYENDNLDPVFVPLGEFNNLSGPGSNGTIGELPTIFMPGSGTFKIQFNGDQLTWSLYTYGSFNKSSISSANQSDTGECDAKLDGSYTLFPNPVTEGYLDITQNYPEVSTVYILNMYGSILYIDNDFNGINESIRIDMSGYEGGLYIVRIESVDQVRTYSIIKQ